MVAFIDQHRERFGVEPICAELPISPSTYYDHCSRKQDPSKCSARSRNDEVLKVEIRRVRDENFQVYGARKVWHQLNREGIVVAPCAVERLMKEMGLRGAVRGRKHSTTVADDALDRPLDRVNRNFRVARPSALWISDLTYVPTSRGYVYVAFVIDAFARQIVGWKASSSSGTDLVLAALEQALWGRGVNGLEVGLIHHSDRGTQYLSIRKRRRLAEAGIVPSVGSVCESYDNALAETIIGLYKTELINRRRWSKTSDVEFATLEWIDWYNNRRLLGSIGYVPPSEMEAEYDRGERGADHARTSSTR